MFLLAANTGFPVIESDPECNPMNNSRNWDTRTRSRVNPNVAKAEGAVDPRRPRVRL
jgi:hypothetical protein